MEENVQILYIVAFSLLLIWFSAESLKLRRVSGNEEMRRAEATIIPRESIPYALVTIFCGILISISYVAYCVYMMGKQEVVPLKSVFSAASWTLSVLFMIHFNQNASVGNNSRWPLALIFWWASFGIFNSFNICIHLIYHFRTNARLPNFFPTASIADFVTFPLFILLLAIVIFIKYKRNFQELEQPLIKKNGNSVDSFATAGIWSKLTFQWLNPIFKKGQTQKLELSHIPSIPESETAKNSYSLLQESLRWQKTKVSSLTETIIHAMWRPLAVNAIFACINTVSSYLGPLLITDFVNFLSVKDAKMGNGYGYMLAFLFFFAKAVESLSQRQWYFGARRIGVRIRAALMTSIYSKSLTVKFSSASNGEIINFLDVDVERIGDFSWYIHGIWLLPIQVSLALIILYKNLGGAASFTALVVTIIVMVSNIPLASVQENLHSKIMEAKDSRIKATTEVLKCMRILKLHSWENVYLNKIFQIRDMERRWVKRYLYACSAIVFVFWTSPTLVSVTTFGVCMITKTLLTPGAVLSALATFKILQDPIYNLPELVSMIAQTKVSIDRIEDFVKEESQRKSLCYNNTKSSNVAVKIKPGEYAWESNNLLNLAIRIKKKIKIRNGEKVAVCGSVGSGKSSFLCSIIGEIPRTSGAGMKLYGSTAYAAQSAWIQTGTIRENILFGKKMEKDFYDMVVEACALDRDVEVWEDGDMTIVGERGINLSGGQKQRIQLARAVYSDSDIYLLDDPFSAVDAHTGGHLFNECLLQLLSSKTVIFVTHQLEFLNAVDLILVMKDGEITQHGKYEDLINDANGELSRQLAAHEKTKDQVSPTKDQNFPSNASYKDEETEGIKETTNANRRSIDHQERASAEDVESGRVQWKVYSTFITKAYKGSLVPIIVLCQVLFQGLQIGSNYWISWATEKQGRVSQEKLMGVFILMSLGSSAFVLARAILLAAAAIETAQRLFVDMTTCIFRAPISFFDFTHSSRILNRSSADQSVVDTDIPYRLGGLVFALVQLLCIITLMSLVVWPVIILFIVVLTISIWYQAYYTGTARDLARMVAIRKAPILHHLSESITGAATIRCFSQENCFINKNLELIDSYSRITFHNYATMEWLSIRINFLFNLVFFVVLIILVALPRSAINPSLAGLATTYGLSLNVLQAWAIWNLCNVENKMISVERILQYTDLPSEAPLVIKENTPEREWPRFGTIKLDNLHVHYGPKHPMILKGITCTFPAKKKIGIVGRTGSGKSTLIQALFRVVEPSKGRIIIDDIDICKIGLHDLRSRLSIIPQDPSLFRGTIRTNLDPLQEHPDSKLWEALRRCHLAEIVMKDRRLLEAPVAEDGENWSVGQRQLVCLARALLKKRRILVLDEATASVDTATDNVIQKTIREETGNCTVISVAHRMATIVDDDLVLVLDEGKVVEYDSPNKLLRNERSAFSKLATQFLRQSNGKDQRFDQRSKR